MPPIDHQLTSVGGAATQSWTFDETKGYVQKVMSNYRVYRELYTQDLERK